jgi:outer membrane receptor protein involved in Fe transport
MQDTLRPNRLTLAVSLAMFGVSVHAEENTKDGALPVVTVTAEHHSEDLQKAPLAIFAFNEKDLEDKHIESIRDLSGQVPNLTLSRQSVSYSAQTYGIRGIYISGDGHWTTTLPVKNLLDRAYPQSVGYVPSSGARVYSINNPRTLLLSMRYDL